LPVAASTVKDPVSGGGGRVPEVPELAVKVTFFMVHVTSSARVVGDIDPRRSTNMNGMKLLWVIAAS
jgi:hypothetical protein